MPFAVTPHENAPAAQRGGGKEAYQKIIELKPHQKIVIVSGFAEPETARELQNLAMLPFVQKPYAIETLAATVKTALA